ncbi:MAG: D-proline reductase (dithiol) PrdB [Candidatus Azotimanducaceae bacterium]
MTARLLEENGIATVIIGSALDIVSYCMAPRFYYNDIPLGNPLGHPYDKEEQFKSVREALEMVADSSAANIHHSGIRWQGGDAWRENYMKVDDSNREELKQQGVQNRLDRRDNALLLSKKK